MRPFRVVVKPPFFCQLAHLFYVPEDVRIQDCPAITAIEAFHITVLRRPAGLDELVLDPVGFTPYPHFLGDELRSVVGPDALRLPVDEDDLLKYRYDLFCRHRHRYLLRYGFTVAIVQYVQYAERTSAFRLVAHKVQGPGLIRLKGSLQGLFYPHRKALLQLAALVEVDLLVHAVHLLVVPGIPIVPQPLVYLLEAVPILSGNADRLFDLAVILYTRVVEV